MTVAEEAPAATIDRATAEQRMDEIFREYWRKVSAFIFFRMEERHRSFAEDLASETFTILWTKYLGAGKDVWGKPSALLYTIARSKIASFYATKTKHLMATVDFSDPANGWIGSGHSYAADQPEIAPLARELDEALEHMAGLSKQWREKHAETHQYSTLLKASRFPTPQRKAEVEAQRRAASAEGARLLEAFRKACSRVGELRIELEEAGGANWCSSTGLPPTARRSYLKPGTLRDPDRTHCDSGHEMTLENTYFGAEGRRRCRTCLAPDKPEGAAPCPPRRSVSEDRIEQVREMLKGSELSIRKVAEMAGMSTNTIRAYLAEELAERSSSRSPRVAEEAIARARELLRDPKLSIRKVAEIVGVPRSTLAERIPDMDKLRDTAAFRRDRTPDELIARARVLLLDPAKKRTLREVSEETGLSMSTFYTRIPNLTEQRRQLYGQAAGKRTRSRTPEPVA